MRRTDVPTRLDLDFSDVRGTKDTPYFFRAMRSGVCSGCDADISPGDLITDDEGDILGKKCCYTLPTPPDPGKICPRCRLELPRSGVCGAC